MACEDDLAAAQASLEAADASVVTLTAAATTALKVLLGVNDDGTLTNLEDIEAAKATLVSAIG